MDTNEDETAGQLGDPHWERWTVDEIADGIARVLVARGATGRPLQRLDELRQAPADAGREASAATLTRQAAMAAESDDDAWTDETETFLEFHDLTAFLGRHRTGKRGLPADRPVREGDVFYVVLPAAPRFETLAVGGAAPVLGRDQLGMYESADVDVWDVTAAARQSAKVAYQRVMAVGTGEEESRG